MTFDIKYLIILAAALLLAACQRDDADGPKGPEAPAIFTVTAPVTSSGTTDEVSDIERITSWWVVIADKNAQGTGTVRAIVESGAINPGITDDRLEAELKRGTYTVLAFANMTQAELKTATGLEFAEGQPLPAAWDTKTYKNFGRLWPSTKAIPMAGHKDVTFTGTPYEVYAIEVVRLVGKIEFLFTNGAATDIEVREVQFGPLQNGDQPLFAPSTWPGGSPEYLNTADTTTVTWTFPDPVADRTLHAGSKEQFSGVIYVHESDACKHPTGRFHLAIRIARGGNTAEESLYALATDIDLINRNDHIRIPVTLTDWSLFVEVMFYPPIGGYPASIIEERNHEFYIKFGSSGRFVITPRVRQGVSGKPLGADRLKVEINRVDTPTVNIIKHEPEADAITREITGELADNVTGSAIYELKVMVKEDSNTRIFTRRLHIIRQNIESTTENED